MYASLLLNFIVPLVMLLVGFLLKKNPVRDMNSHNGYNTRVSRRSRRHWDYAQSIAPDIFIGLGIRSVMAEILLNVFLFVFHVPIHISVITGTILGYLFLFWAFWKTDNRIKGEFGEKTG